MSSAARPSKEYQVHVGRLDYWFKEGNRFVKHARSDFLNKSSNMNSPSFLSTPFSLPIDAFTILVASVVLVVSGTTTGGHHDNLITNSSFEQPMAGVPTIPDQWSVRFVDRGDHVQRVRDPTWAHRGRACVRLSSLAGDGITLDALPTSGIEFRPCDP